jgi:hypothetical protein
MIRKSTPWGGRCGFILICGVNLDLIVAREAVHEGQGLMAGAVIDNLVNERRRKVVFGKSVIEVSKVHTNVDSTLVFVNRDGVGDP